MLLYPVQYRYIILSLYWKLSDLRLPASVFNYLLCGLCATDILFLCSNLLVFIAQVSLNIRHFSPGSALPPRALHWLSLWQHFLSSLRECLPLLLQLLHLHCHHPHYRAMPGRQGNFERPFWTFLDVFWSLLGLGASLDSRKGGGLSWLIWVVFVSERKYCTGGVFPVLVPGEGQEADSEDHHHPAPHPCRPPGAPIQHPKVHCHLSSRNILQLTISRFNIFLFNVCCITTTLVHSNS